MFVVAALVASVHHGYEVMGSFAASLSWHGSMGLGVIWAGATGAGTSWRCLCCTASRKTSLGLRVSCVCRVAYHWGKDRSGPTMSYPFLFNHLVFSCRCFCVTEWCALLGATAQGPEQTFCIYALHDEGRRFSRFAWTDLKHFAVFIRPHRVWQDTFLMSMFGNNARVPAGFPQNLSKLSSEPDLLGILAMFFE